jgi:hypothetical protein
VRRPLLCVGLVVAVALAGCVGVPTASESPESPATNTPTTSSDVDEEYDDRVDSVQVAPGGTTTITLDLHDVGELYLPPESENPGENAPVTLETDWGALSPEPARVVETLPPYWVWDAVQSTVSVTFTVAVEPGTSPGTYDVVYEAYDDTSHDHQEGTFGTIRVQVVAE